MGRNSGGGSRGGLQPGDGNYKGKIAKVESLIHIKDPQAYKAVVQAISRYHAVMGVRQRNVKLAELGANTYGVHVTVGGKSDAVYLNKSHFNQSKNKIAADHKRGYDTGWSTRTNKPVAHTVTHELAHATWNAHLTGAKQVAAGKEVNKLYVTWLKDKKKTGYGQYAKTNVSEFWAETATKAVHGKADKYTKAVKKICKKYDL